MPPDNAPTTLNKNEKSGNKHIAEIKYVILQKLEISDINLKE